MLKLILLINDFNFPHTENNNRNITIFISFLLIANVIKNNGSFEVVNT